MEKQVPISPFTDLYLYLSLLSCAMLHYHPCGFEEPQKHSIMQ